MTRNQSRQFWRDCLRLRGRRLVGHFAHYCAEWDGLPVDETTPDFEACTCFGTETVTVPRDDRA